MTIQRYGRYWAVFDADELVCVCVYRRGAEEVVRRLSSRGATPAGTDGCWSCKVTFPATAEADAVCPPCGVDGLPF